MLTEQQQKFCKRIALYEDTPIQAFINAGYEVKQYRYIKDRVLTLLGNKNISDEIDRLRKKYLSLEDVRKDIILEHQQTRDLDITEILSPVPYTDQDGIKRYRVEIKPIAEWSYELRKACTGFDKNGVPIFRNKETATKELSRLFGLYKDNTVVVEQDLDGILKDAMGESADNIDADDIDIEGLLNDEEMQTLDAQLMEQVDDDQRVIERDREDKKHLKEHPEDTNIVKLRNLLNP